jgi:hypothetical protein
MTDKELAEIERRAAAASAGPWYTDGVCGFPWTIHADKRERSVLGNMGRMHPLNEIIADCRPTLNGNQMPFNDPDWNGWADAWFIAHAREYVPALVAEIRRLKALLKRKRATH